MIGKSASREEGRSKKEKRKEERRRGRPPTGVHRINVRQGPLRVRRERRVADETGCGLHTRPTAGKRGGGRRVAVKGRRRGGKEEGPRSKHHNTSEGTIGYCWSR